METKTNTCVTLALKFEPRPFVRACAGTRLPLLLSLNAPLPARSLAAGEKELLPTGRSQLSAQAALESGDQKRPGASLPLLRRRGQSGIR